MSWDYADSFVVVLQGLDARPLAIHGPFLTYEDAQAFVERRPIHNCVIWPMHRDTTAAVA